MNIALIGNQNSGKTTLFNQLTGANQHVGNFPGVTIEKKTGKVKQHNMHIVDLPGIYSLSPYSLEEVVTRDFLINERPDIILNIVDVTNIERNLYLTFQLIDLGRPMVVALNMMDEFSGSGGIIDVDGLSKALGVPVVPISAVKAEGLEDLISTIIQTVKQITKISALDYCEGAIHRCLNAISHIVEDNAKKLNVSRYFVASKLIEGDEPLQQQLQLDTNQLSLINHHITLMESEIQLDREAALADIRYSYIEKLVQQLVKKPTVLKEYYRSVKIDRWLTHKYLGIPLFGLFMFTIFWLTFQVIGSWLSEWLDLGLTLFTEQLATWLAATSINVIVKDLLINGVLTGVGSVLSFLPYIVVLFFFLSLLEDSGYMARVAYVMDKPLRKIGLSGRSLVPLLIGFGCSVPAIMATRVLSSKRDRFLTVILIPFMSCSAKLPVYALFAGVFFPDHAAIVMMGMYLFGVLIAILSALTLRHSIFRGKSTPFILELPNYRLPNLKTVIILMWDKAKDFITRAFTVIFIASIMIWFFQSFDFQLNTVSNIADSMVAKAAIGMESWFIPLGFGDWRAVTALISGFSAKEVVVSTLAILNGGEELLNQGLLSMFTMAGAISFLVFTLLYTPCFAAVSSIKRELGWLKTIGVIIFQLGIAYVVSFLVYQMVILL
jgi:ferrous iron transport protein B